MAEKELNAQQEATSKKEEKAAAKAAKAAAKAAANADSKKSGKKKEEKKKNIFSRLAGWFKDLKKEFKKVVWPERKKVVNNTLVVLAVVVIGSVLVGLIDSGLLRLMQYLMGLSN